MRNTTPYREKIFKCERQLKMENEQNIQSDRGGSWRKVRAKNCEIFLFFGGEWTEPKIDMRPLGRRHKITLKISWNIKM